MRGRGAAAWPVVAEVLNRFRDLTAFEVDGTGTNCEECESDYVVRHRIRLTSPIHCCLGETRPPPAARRARRPIVLGLPTLRSEGLRRGRLRPHLLHELSHRGD